MTGYRELTRDYFKDLKADYPVYGTHTEQDKYNNEKVVVDGEPKGTINVMWQPLTDEASIAEYGKSINRMYYCILYDDVYIDYNDVVYIHGDAHEVVGIKYFNTYTRIDVSRKEG